jgi:hypothetical protein
MVEVSNWMHVDFFTVDQASALWCDYDPAKVSILGYNNPPEIMAVKQLLIGGIVSGAIASDSSLNSLHIIGNFSDTLISRAELEKFARMKKLFPAFLFNTLAPFEKAESPLDRFNSLAAKMAPIPQPEQPANQGGRPPEYDWDSFMLEIIHRANTPDGLPDSQAELVRDMSVQNRLKVQSNSELPRFTNT